jgi:hypothetical protein
MWMDFYILPLDLFLMFHNWDYSQEVEQLYFTL